MRKLMLSAITGILLAGPAAFSQNAHAVRAAKLMEQLRQVPIAEVPTDVPASAKALLTQAKQELRDFFADLLNETRDVASDADLRNAAIARLQSSGILFHFSQPGTTIESDAPEYDQYGYLTEVNIAQPEGHPELRAVVLTLQIPCGSDSTFSIFQKNDSGWNRILTEEASDYDKISGAYGSFDYAISPSAPDGSWFVLTANVNPWCSSDWQTIRYAVQRPGTDPDRPVTVFSKSGAVFLGEDEVYKLKALADRFEVAYFGDEPLDTEKLIRVHTEEFDLLGNQVHRLPPVALAPQEFVDEWAHLTWDEAVQWIEADRPDQLKTWHDKLKQTDAHSYNSQFVFAQPCAENGPERWQVGLAVSPDANAKDLPRQIFFTVLRKDGAFLMQEISDRRSPGCPGEAAPTDSWTGYNLP